MIKVVLVDDEQPAIEELKYLIRTFETIEVAATFNSPTSALQYLLLNQVDAVFLDVSMPEMDGFLFAEALLNLKNPPLIIFVTAYDDYAIQAFEISAIDYLLKPIMEERLALAVTKLQANLGYALKTKPLKDLLHDRHKQNKTARLPLWRSGCICLLNHEDVNCIEAKKGAIILYTDKGKFTSNDSLQYYEDILSESGFFRCHRSFIVRIESIVEVMPCHNNTYALKVAGYSDIKIPVSRRNIKVFKQMLNL